MNVLLIQPPHYYSDKTRMPAFFPIGLGYIARVLLDAGHNIEVLDIYAHQYKNEEVAQKLKEIDFDIVCISAMSTQYNYTKWLTAQIKRMDMNTKIILGGALATFSPHIVLENTDVDVCVIGEGERTITELLERIRDLKEVKGIYFKEDGRIAKTPIREYIEEIDTIPFPAYDLFPIEIYLKNSFVIGVSGPIRIKTASIISGRGCPFSCNFCSKVFSGLRLRSINNIIEELKYLKRRLKIEGAFFNDELAIVNKKRVYELCDKISQLDIKWNCQGRVNNVDIDLLCYMKRAGCTAIGYGIESGSQKILDAMNKRVTVRQAEQAIKDTVKAGLHPVVQLMFGYPGETKDTIQETIDFFRRVDSPGDAFSPVTPLPGTELWKYTLNMGLIKDEKTLLEQLDGGYMPDAHVLVNYTSFSDDELSTLRRDTEREIIANYYRKHPVRFLRYFLFNIKSYVKSHGYLNTIKRIFTKYILRT
jgi:anaerobic magnesium-protoporphyrin IX monomethyl ester cyclase